MYNIEDFIGMAVAIWAIIERLKPLIKPAIARFNLEDDEYAIFMQVVAFAVGLLFTLPAEADFLLAVGYGQFDPLIGAIVGAAVMSFGVQAVEFVANLRHGLNADDIMAMLGRGGDA
jgi:hypothetical protein